MEMTVKIIDVTEGELKAIELDGIKYKLLKTTEIAKLKPQLPIKTKKKYRRLKPRDALGFDKTYKTYIGKKESALVKQAISKTGYNYTPDISTISEESKLTESRVRAIIHYLRSRNEVALVRLPKNKQKIKYTIID